MSELTIKGIYRDRLLDARGREIYDSGWRSNTIVLRCRELLAAFMKNDSTETKLGIAKIKFGRGDTSWDTNGAAIPDQSITALVDGDPYIIDRGALDAEVKLEFQYLDANGQLASGVTNRIQVIITLGQNKPTPATDPPFPMREFGLFGALKMPGDALSQEYMINCIRHPLIEKDGSMSMERRIQLTF